MWARHFEVALGLWLAVSPFALRHPSDASGVWWTDLTCSAALVILPLLTYWRPLRRVHLFELAVAAWLVLFGRFVALPTAPAAAQNEIVVGLLVAMLAIVPSEAASPPPGWRPHPRA